MGSKPPSTTTQINKTELDPVTQAAKQKVFDQAGQLYGQGPAQYYPGQTYVGASDRTQQGMNYLTQQAQQGAFGMGQAQDAASRAMSGVMPGMGTAQRISMGVGAPNPWAMQQQGAQGVAQGSAGMVQQGTMSNPWATNVAGAGLTPNAYTGQIAANGQRGTNTSMLNPWATNGGQNQYAGAIQQAGQASANGAGTQGLQSISAGGANPELEAQIRAASADVANTVNSQAGMYGRAGSGAHAGVLANEVGDMASRMRMEAYEADQSRRLSASGALAGFENAGLDRNLSAQQTAAGLGEAQMGRQFDASGQITQYGAADQSRNLAALQSAGALQADDLGRRMQGFQTAGQFASDDAGRNLQGADLWGNLLNQDANRAYQGVSDSFQAGMQGRDQQLQGAQLASSMWNQSNAMGLAGASALPGLYQYGQMPGQSMLDLGSMDEGYQQAALQADMDRFNYGQNAGWNNLAQYANMVNGLPVAATQSQTATAPGGSRVAGGLSGMMGGAGIAGALSLSNPWTAGLAGVGALAGFL